MKITIETETLNATTEDFDTAIEILKMLASKDGQIVNVIKSKKTGSNPLKKTGTDIDPGFFKETEYKPIESAPIEREEHELEEIHPEDVKPDYKSVDEAYMGEHINIQPKDPPRQKLSKKEQIFYDYILSHPNYTMPGTCRDLNLSQAMYYFLKQQIKKKGHAISGVVDFAEGV